MYKVIIEWQGSVAIILEESSFYSELRNIFPIENKSREYIESLIYGILDNLSCNHYGLFSQQTEIEHRIGY
jgi:hypothetical protein